MYPGWHVLIYIALRTAVIYGVVLLGMRLSGKREVGQMTPFDLTLLLASQQCSAERDDRSGHVRVGGVVAAATFLLLNFWSLRSRVGIADSANLSRANQACWSTMARLSPRTWPESTSPWTSCNELFGNTELPAYHDVALAVLEVDGSISCMKYDDIKPTASTHLARRKILKKHQ